MKHSIILDASFLIALLDSKDRWHHKAEELFVALEASGAEAIVFDCIANETATVLARRAAKKGKQAFSQSLRQAEGFIRREKLNWLYPSVPEKYTEILDTMKGSEGGLSFHDALLVLAVRQYEIPYIASFDQDFDEVEGIVRVKEKGDLEK